MPRGTTLSECLEMLRFEAGHSGSRALGRNSEAALRNLLRRMQTFLWADYYWPFLEVERTKQLQAGSRYYAFPDDLDSARVRFMDVRWSAHWVPTCFGIGNAEYNAMDPSANQRNAPVLKWDWRKNIEQEAEQVSGQMFEVWPLPAVTSLADDHWSEGTLKFTGIRKLRPFTADNHVCDLDDYLIVVFAAAKMLGRQKLQDGQEAMSAAQAYYGRLRGNTVKAPMFILAGESDDFSEPEHIVRVSYARAPP